MMRNTTPLAYCTNTSVTYDYTDLGALFLWLYVLDKLVIGWNTVLGACRRRRGQYR